eukprot:EG_transcript_18546
MAPEPPAAGPHIDSPARPPLEGPRGVPAGLPEDDSDRRARALIEKGMPFMQAILLKWRAAMSQISQMHQRGQYPGLRYEGEEKALAVMMHRSLLKGLGTSCITWGVWWMAWRPQGGMALAKNPVWWTVRLFTVLQGFKFGVDHEMQHSIVNFEPLEDSIVLDHICPLVLEYPQRVSDTYLRVCRNYTARHPAASDGDGDARGPDQPLPLDEDPPIRRPAGPPPRASATPAAGPERSWTPERSLTPAPVRPRERTGETLIREDADGVLRIENC